LKINVSIEFPFGVGCAGIYRFTFNGKELDNEVAGAANCIVYEERIYDPRLEKTVKFHLFAE
jgi:hypothetical protein